MAVQKPQPDEVEVMADIVSNRRRRLIVDVLDKYGALCASDLAREVASIETDKPVDHLDQDEYKRVYVALYQTHGPKLEKSGVLDVEDRDLYVQGERFNESKRVIRALRGEPVEQSDPSLCDRLLSLFQ